MNEIDLWNEAENLEEEKEARLQNIAYNLFELFGWYDNATSEDNFDYIYNRIWKGDSTAQIMKDIGNE